MKAKTSREEKSPFKGIARRVSPTQQVREQILEAIERRDFSPGEALPSERALCEMFGVSRVSVREAIAGLEAMGIVTVQHGRGSFVADGTREFGGAFGRWLHTHRDRMVELLKVRGALDELAAYEAAQRQDPEALRDLREIHETFRELATSPDPDRSKLIETDVMFHEAVAQAADSQLLSELCQELAGHIADSRRLTFATEGQAERSAREHEAILDAILSGDAETAKLAAAAHVRGIRQWIEAQGASKHDAPDPGTDRGLD
jgi:DNA-binding FadR family transcriptional regulator